MEYSADRLVEFVQTINMNILPFHMEIKKGINESSGASAYALVSYELLTTVLAVI